MAPLGPARPAGPRSPGAPCVGGRGAQVGGGHRESALPIGPPPITPKSHLGSGQPVLPGESTVARSALWKKKKRGKVTAGCGVFVFFGVGGSALHTPFLRGGPQGRRHQVHHELLSCLPHQPARGHLGVLRGPEEEEEKGSEQQTGTGGGLGFSSQPPPPTKSPISGGPHGAACHDGAGAQRPRSGKRPHALRLVNEAMGECPRPRGRGGGTARP